jgi:ring-1,2-phenylacetyl-CoA epoxidase subunit PaaD
MTDENRVVAKIVTCPFCDSTETEMIALFGMQMMTSQYYCRYCHSVFEAVKWEPPQDADSTGPGLEPQI